MKEPPAASQEYVSTCRGERAACQLDNVGQWSRWRCHAEDVHNRDRRGRYAHVTGALGTNTTKQVRWERSSTPLRPPSLLIGPLRPLISLVQCARPFESPRDLPGHHPCGYFLRSQVCSAALSSRHFCGMSPPTGVESTAKPDPLSKDVLKGGLFKSEYFWRDHQSWLADMGYMLRPRYRQDWEPSWVKTKESYFLCEDGQATVVSCSSLRNI